MTLRRGNLDDMSMRLYSLKQTDTIRSNPQLLIAQFIGLCSSLKWSSHLTKSPFLALPATAGSNAAYKIISACSNALC